MKKYGHNNIIIVLINGTSKGISTVVKGDIGWLSWLFEVSEGISKLYYKKRDLKLGLDKLHDLVDTGVIDIVRMTPNHTTIWSKDRRERINITKEEKEWLKYHAGYAEQAGL